jgi:hypothetical protein
MRDGKSRLEIFWDIYFRIFFFVYGLIVESPERTSGTN